MRKEELAKEYILLNRLGLTANYTGFFQTAYAVALCAEEPERLRLVTKWVYPEVARRFKTTQAAVERNVRTAGSVIWKGNRRLLEELAQHPEIQTVFLATEYDVNYRAMAKNLNVEQTYQLYRDYLDHFRLNRGRN